VAATSNVAAYVRYGVPVAGTMDHFAVQAWERDGVPRHVTERAFFEHFFGVYGPAATLLVDTYDTFGEETGLRAAVAATGGRLGGVRIDSGVTVQNIRRARALLDALGAPQAKITVSGGLDEEVIKTLNTSPVDAYGVGERIVTSSDAPVGVGAVAKLAEVDGRPTMKLSRGSGKATLPGRVQVFRSPGGVDVVGLHDEDLDGEPLLQLAWDAQGPVHDANPPSPPERLRAALAAMPPEALVPREAKVAVSQRLQDLITSLVRSA
jgi:nicotinate phosphoribosyltransferase